MSQPEEKNDKSETKLWKRDVAVAAIAGIAAAALITTATVLIGTVGSYEARALVEAVLPTSRFLCSSVIAASATILALMLTLVGMATQADYEMEAVFYRRIRQISFYDMLVLLLSTTFLLLHCIPIAESNEVPEWWYKAVYYTLLGISALMSGALCTIVVMIYAALRDIIRIFGLERDPSATTEGTNETAPEN